MRQRDRQLRNGRLRRHARWCLCLVLQLSLARKPFLVRPGVMARSVGTKVSDQDAATERRGQIVRTKLGVAGSSSTSALPAPSFPPTASTSRFGSDALAVLLLFV